MALKKLTAASALAALALVGCAKDEVQNPVASNEPSAGEQAASGSSASKTVAFEVPYEVGSNKVMMKGRMVLENGIVKSVEVPGAMGPQATFVAGVEKAAYGKPVKGLQVDAISGASLTTAAFNEFLKSVE